MYGAMREHAPRSTHLAGAITAATATLAFGYALANGMGNYIAGALPDPIVYVPLSEDTPPTQPPPDADKLDITSDTLTLAAPDPVVDHVVFTAEDDPITGTTDPVDRIDPRRTNNVIPPPPHAPVRTAAKLLPFKQPPYPVSEIRKQNEGISSLEVCLDRGGQVTSAALAASSGHPVLDQAALKWVRNLRFTPARIDGAPQAICGHSVVYEWTLKDAR